MSSAALGDEREGSAIVESCSARLDARDRLLALAAASSMPSKEAVRRLLSVTLAGLRPPLVHRAAKK